MDLSKELLERLIERNENRIKRKKEKILVDELQLEALKKKLLDMAQRKH